MADLVLVCPDRNCRTPPGGAKLPQVVVIFAVSEEIKGRFLMVSMRQKIQTSADWVPAYLSGGLNLLLLEGLPHRGNRDATPVSSV